MARATRVTCTGQAIVEYSIIVVTIAAAVTAMSLYAQRAMQAKIKAMADRVGDQTMGIRYESGDRLRKQSPIGQVQARENASDATTDRQITRTTTADGGVRTDVVRDTVTVNGAVQGRGPRVAAFTRTVINAGK